MAKIKLDEISTRAPKDFEKDDTKKKTTAMLDQLDDLQNLLYANGKHSLLVILQGMDASGKDGVIRNVFGKLNPQGVKVESFKTPTEKELAHDFLWRIHMHTPAKGEIQIFNRSHYENVLITRVHKWIDDKTARKRMKAMNDFEQLLTSHNDTKILKFYLHISRKEQEERLAERMKNPAKMWKYNKKDQEEAKYWEDYKRMYEDCFEHCDVVPWTIVPADQNWYKEYLITKEVFDTLSGLKMKYPGLEENKSQ